MAKILDKTLTRRHQRSRRKYDWENWANGKAWLLKQGVDYDSSANVKTAAMHYAAYHGLTVTTRVMDGGVELQFFRPKPKKLLKRTK